MGKAEQFLSRKKVEQFSKDMDVKTIELIFLGNILILASIFGVEADKISEKDREVPKLAKQGNNLEETAAVRALSLKNVILQRRLTKEDIERNRKKTCRKRANTRGR